MQWHRTLSLFVALAGSATTGCDAIGGLFGKDDRKSADDDDEDRPRKKKKKKSDDDDPAASVSASASAVVAPPPAPSSADAAPTMTGGLSVSIPAGTLRAGHSCGAVPRVTDEELAGTNVALGAFEIDVHPYPNDPALPPRTGVSRAEAESLCAERGKRLCSELEWERACKGPDQRTFSYGDGYDKDACAALASALPGARPKCASAFGVRDLHGLGFEWTSSPWGRGKPGLATVRGWKGSANVVRERCASGQGRSADERAADVGFRCCKGASNPQVVDLTLVREPLLVEDAPPSRERVSDLLRAMPSDHQSVQGASLSFSRAWRWHPRDNEQLVVAEWKGQPDDKTAPFFELAVFKECGGKPSRIARMRGPVDKLERLRDASPEKLVVGASTEKDKGEVTLTYWYGSVKFVEPEWIKPGNRLERKAEPKRTVGGIPVDISSKLRPKKK